MKKVRFYFKKDLVIKKKNPNKWAKTGGQVDSGESVENAIFREVKRRTRYRDSKKSNKNI